MSEIQSGINQQENLLQLFNQNRGLIETVLRPYLSICERDDLEQEAFCGLLHAIEKYNPEQGCLFMSFALPWIRQTLARYAHNSGQIRIPEHIVNQLYQMNHAVREYEAEHGCFPPDSVLCAVLRISLDELQRLKQIKHNIHGAVSLSAPALSDDEEITLEDIVPDKRDDISSVLDEIESTQIWNAVDDLDEEHRQEIRARFLDGMQYKQIAALCGRSIDEVKKAEKTALRQLRSDPRIKEAGEVRGYYSRTSKAYQGGLRRFLESGESIVEHMVLDKLEPEESETWM